MSYILDALKKAEKQREIGQVPGIDSVHDVGGRGPRQRWPWVLAAILALNAVIIGALFWPDRQGVEDRRRSADSAPGVTVAPRPAAPAAEPGHRQAPAQTVPAVDDGGHAPSAVAGPGPVMPGSAGEPMPGRPTPAPGSDAAVARSSPPETGAPTPTAAPDVTTRPLKPLPLPQAPVAAGPPGRAQQPAQDPAAAAPRARVQPQATAVAVTPPTPAAAAPAGGRLPVWPLVDDDLYRKVNGDLDVNVHVFSKIPGDRFVFLNMKIYREGDQLLEGPRLEEITQDGVILSLGGERFRVPAR